ncbi:MAG TPA: ABC transporter permease [Gemmataceae bacterium]|nr:ABC transporter permease [Gemmataceae bacterium]
MSLAAEITRQGPTEPDDRPAAAGAGPAEPPLTVIEPRPGWHFLDLGEMWRYRELLFFLAWRDVMVRYKQTALGAAWAVLQPFATMVVFSLFFSKLNDAPAGAAGASLKVPYPLFVFAGLLPWTFFATAIVSAGNSVVGCQQLVTKVYFPRLLIPLGAVGAALVDFAIAFAMLLVIMLYYWVLPGWGFLWLPLLALGLLAAAVGVGTWLAALTVTYRDFRFVIPFMVQLWMFATPSIYVQPDRVISPTLQSFLPLNPAYGLILNFRLAILGRPLDLYPLAMSLAVSLLLLLAGCLCFRRAERGFADVI